MASPFVIAGSGTAASQGHSSGRPDGTTTGHPFTINILNADREWYEDG